MLLRMVLTLLMMCSMTKNFGNHVPLSGRFLDQSSGKRTDGCYLQMLDNAGL